MPQAAGAGRALPEPAQGRVRGLGLPRGELVGEVAAHGGLRAGVYGGDGPAALLGEGTLPRRGATVAGMVEHDALTVTRAAYDEAADLYARLFSDSLRDCPLDRAMLAAFAEAVGEGGRVADLGCGPGHVTGHLAGLGLDAFGVDASPAMIELARRDRPELRFEVGGMAALDLADGALDGVLSRWSVIHTPPAELPAVLAEFSRVLAPGGHLLIGFSATDGPSHPTQSFDHAVVTAYRWAPDHLAGLLRAEGLTETARLIREPGPDDRRPFQEVHLLARKA